MATLFNWQIPKQRPFAGDSLDVSQRSNSAEQAERGPSSRQRSIFILVNVIRRFW